MVSIWDAYAGYICGGALISFQHALTAGHCVDIPNAIDIIDVSYFQSLLKLNNFYTFCSGNMLWLVFNTTITCSYDSCHLNNINHDIQKY